MGRNPIPIVAPPLSRDALEQRALDEARRLYIDGTLDVEQLEQRVDEILTSDVAKLKPLAPPRDPGKRSTR